MAKPPPPAAAPRGQRVLAAMAFTLIGLSAVAVVVLLVLRGVGVPASAFTSGGLAVLQLLPLPGLTIGLLLLIVLIVTGLVSRSRAARR